MMTKSSKISLIVCSVIVVLLTSVTLYADRILTRIICTQLDNSIAQLDSMDIRYGDVDLVILAGKLRVSDVYFQTDTLYSLPDSTRAVTRVEVGHMSIDGINYWNWILRRALDVRGITIEQPQITSWVINRDKDSIENVMGDELREQLKAEQELRQQQMLEMARVFVEEATIRRITIRDAHVHIGAINNQLRSNIKDASFEINGIGYSFIDSIPYHYNDSVFHFDIRNVDITLPDGQTTIHSDGLTARPGGIMHIDTTWAYASLSNNNRQFVDAHIDGLHIGGFDVQKFNQTKSLDIRSLHLDHPSANVRISTQVQPNAAKTKRLTDEQKKHQQMLREQQEIRLHEMQQQVMMFLNEVCIDTIQLHNICGQFFSSNDHLYAGLDSLSLGVYDVGYSLLDSIPYHYNDSVYDFHITMAHVITPDSLVDIVTHDINYNNGGAFSIGRTRVHHICDKWELGAIKGNTPQAWIDLTMGELRTSRKNVVREALTLEDGFQLDSVFVRIDNMYIFKDNRYKPNKPFSLPQEAMMNVDYPFHIRCLNAELKKMDIDVAMSREAVGHMALGPLKASVSNITAVRDETIRVKAKGNLGKGAMDIAFNLKVNRACNWDMAIDGRNLNLHDLDDFIYPIVGMRIGCNVQHLKTRYSGDSQLATGTFCMEYTDLDVVADKESPSPIKVVAKMSGLINSFAKTCLPHQNPYQPGMEPRAYNVKWKNDPWKEPAFFYIGPIIHGAVETMLPGIFAFNKVKKEDQQKQK